MFIIVSKKIIQNIIVLTLVLSMSFTPAFSLGNSLEQNKNEYNFMPFVSAETRAPLIVMFGDSIAEQSALTELLKQLPNAITLLFNFNDESKIIIEWQGSIIWVGHGDDYGIKYQNSKISWSLLTDLVKSTNSDTHYFLSCNSANIKRFIHSNKHIFTFDNKIDSVLGAKLISFLYKPSKISMYAIIDTLNSIVNNPKTRNYLGRFGGSEWDAMYWLAASIMLIIFPLTMAALGLTTAAAISSTFAAGIAASIGTGLYLLANFFSALKDGFYVDAFVYFVSLMAVILTTIEAIIAGYGWVVRAAANSAKVIESVASLTWPKMMLISAGMAMLLVTVVGFLSDLADWDTTIFSRER